MVKDRTTKTALIVMIATLASKILGFAREVLLGSTYGASAITDAYLISITVPTILFASLAGAIGTTYIPIYSEIKNRYDNSKGLLFTNNILNLVAIVSIVVSVIGITCARPIVSLIAIGFDPETLDLAVKFSRITFPMVIFIGLTYVFIGYLQSNNKFLAPALINIPNNLILIIVLAMSNLFGINGLIFGTLLGSLFQVLILIPSLKSNGFKYKFLISLSDPYIQKVGLLAFPVVIGMAVQQINTLVDRMLASGLVEGSISALNFANKLNGFVYGVFSISITTVIYPLLSDLISKDKLAKLKDIFTKSINVITILMLPITVGSIVLRLPVVSVLFERGHFDHQATTMTASALLFYSLGMVFFGYRDVLNRVYYSLQDTKTPMVNGIIAVLMNIVINLILVQYLQHSGLALATSITAGLTTLLLFLNLKRKIGNIGGKGIVIVFFKALIASILMGVIVSFADHTFSNIEYQISWVFQLIKLLGDILIGVIVYAGVLILLRVEEIYWVLQLVRSKFSVRKV